MKTSKYIWTLFLALVTLGFTACSDDDDNGSGTPMQIAKVFLENVNDTVNKDREVTFARLGQLIRIEGSGFTGLKKVLINGYETYFNNALMTDNNVWVTLNGDTPVDKADPEVRNTITLVKSGDNRLVYQFTIRAAAPSVSSCDNTLPMPGEKVTVYGSNLQETTTITLPGGIVVNSGIENDEDGKFFSFIMPEGVTESGSITSQGANGTAISPAYFNNFDCFITNFDGTGELGEWSATYASADLVDDPLNTGRGKVALVVPEARLLEGGLDAGSNSLLWATAGNDNANDDWTGRMYNFIPAGTNVSEVALQFDIYCPEPWDGSGQLEFSLQNNLSNYGYGSGCTKYSEQYTNTAAVWVPWLKDDGSHAPFTTGQKWQTVTIPMTQFGNYDAAKAPEATFQKICEDRNSGSYRNFLFLFVNSDLEFSDDIVYKASLFSQRIYIDNLRVVKTTAITVSDF